MEDETANWTCDKCLSLVDGKCTTPQITCSTNLKRQEEDPHGRDETDNDADQPVQENPVAEAEEDLRAGLILDAKMRLARLTDLLGDPDGSTARLLYLIEKLAAHYAEMTALLGTGARPDDWKPGTEEGDPATIGNVAETFGVQVLKQFLPLLKSFLDKKDAPVSLPGMNLPYTASICRRPFDSFAVGNLVSAMARAKSAGMEDLVLGLRAKLDEVMADHAVEAAPGAQVAPDKPPEAEGDE